MNIKNKILLALNWLLLLPQRVWATETEAAEDAAEAAKSNEYLKTTLNGVINVKQNSEGTMNGITDTLKTVLNFTRGAGIIVCVIMLVYVAVQLAASAGNQQKRQLAMEGIKNVLIAVAIIGGAALIASLAYGVLNK